MGPLLGKISRKTVGTWLGFGFSGLIFLWCITCIMYFGWLVAVGGEYIFYYKVNYYVWLVGAGFALCSALWFGIKAFKIVRQRRG